MYDIKNASKRELIDLIKNNFVESDLKLREEAVKIREKYYGKKVYLRGLIEISNFCCKGCYYCGINSKIKNIKRYRLTKEEILNCCRLGYDLGFKTFVLQGGEDNFFDTKTICDIVYNIKSLYNDCAITLSLGEKSYDDYKNIFLSGANRYLLRHESATNQHYKMLHPKDYSLINRKKCLYNLKEIGFQVGAGFLVDSPFQKIEHLANELIFLRELEPHMVGIGPFIPSKNTIFKNEPKGTLEHTLVMLSLIRLLLPKVLLPSTTALGTIDGYQKGIQAGANVVMPNLSPTGYRRQYNLYDNKICTGDEALKSCRFLINEIHNCGYIADFSRGDYIN